MNEGAGDRFQQETKYSRERMRGGSLDFASRPGLYKQYPGCPEVILPDPEDLGDVSLVSALRGRRSVRDYLSEPITPAQLSSLLWASTGIQRREGGHEFRTAPSAGALYPIETYPVINRVEGFDAGVYHYNIARHSLELIREGDFGAAVAAAALEQPMCAECAVAFVWSAVFQRCRWKYKQRAYRYIYLDAGHIAQNLALAAAALGLGTCQVGAIFDDEANGIVGVDGVEESVIYITVVGRKA